MSDKPSNTIYKKILRGFGRYSLYTSRWIISRLPERVYKMLAFCFVAIGSPFIISKKRLALRNLHTAFTGEKSEDEITRIAERCFKNFGEGMIDLIYYIDRPKKNFERVSFEGKEKLDKVLEQGNGAILLSAHFGNFILMYIRLALEGYKVNVIMRRVRDEDLEEYISKFRNENGIQTIYSLPPRQCVVNCLKRLRDNEILFILLDQNYGDAGRVFVDFFGQQAATATGPVVFSERSGAPILPTFICNAGVDRFKIKIFDPIKFPANKEGEAETVRNVAFLTKIIEDQIRRSPHEWGGWMHKRWKSQKTNEELERQRN